MVDEDDEALLAVQLEREHVDARQGALNQARDVALDVFSFSCTVLDTETTTPTDEKWARPPARKPLEMVSER